MPYLKALWEHLFDKNDVLNRIDFLADPIRKFIRLEFVTFSRFH